MTSSSRESRGLPLENLQPRSSTSSQQTPAYSPTLYQGQPPMTQRPMHNSRYSRITEAKGKPYGGSDFYTDADVLRHAPAGLPSVVAAQAQYPNINLHRRFRHLNNEILTYLLLQLSCVEDAIDELYVKLGNRGGARGLTSLPFDREEFTSRCRQSPDHLSVLHPPKEDDLPAQLQNLMANAARISQEYHEALLWEHKVQRFSPVSHRAHGGSFWMLRDHHGLDGEALDPWRAIDDLITLDTDLVYERFERLLYTNMSWITNGLQYLCAGRLPFGAGDEDPRMEVTARRFRWAVKGFMGLISSALVLVPIGALYLGLMDRTRSFVIVVVFGFLFGLVITAVDPRMAPVCIGSTAYYAVLASILSNLS